MKDRQTDVGMPKKRGKIEKGGVKHEHSVSRSVWQATCCTLSLTLWLTSLSRNWSAAGGFCPSACCKLDSVRRGDNGHTMLLSLGHHTSPLETQTHTHLQVQHNLGATAQLLAFSVTGDGEGATSLGLPGVLLIIGVLGGHSHAVSHKVGRVEAHTELPNHGHISTSGQSLHEGLGSTPAKGLLEGRACAVRWPYRVFGKQYAVRKGTARSK
eukprot:1151686-Pelagomonas_calceolata.AAC.7